MKTQFTASLAAVAVAALLLLTQSVMTAQVQDKAEAAFKAAMDKEVIEGDLKGAIEQYKKIAQGKDRPLAAKALLRMAECYQKLGDSESRKVYERVVREYPDQKDAVVQARTRLGYDATARETGVTARRLWGGDDVNLAGGLSPDGRYLAFSKSGNLAVRDLTTGESRLLTNDAVGYAYAAVFSPDGKQIAYNWASFKDGFFEDYSLRLIGVDGSRPRVLLRRQGLDPWVAAWSPNGKQIAAAFWNYDGDRSREIALVSVADGSVTQLKSTGWRLPTIGGFSKDGRFLVYSLPKSSSANDGGIFALAIDGSRETALIQSAANDSSPKWSHRGDAVFFLSDRSGTEDLWSIRVADGKPQGSPELIRANMGRIINMGFGTDGSYFYGTLNSRSDVYVAGFDPETLRVTSQPSLLTENVVGSNQQPAWSPDGEFVAFFRGKGNGQMLVVRSLSNGAERVLPTKFENVNAFYGVAPIWLLDSRSLLVLDLTTNSKRILRKIDIETGQDRVLLDFPLAWPEIRLSHDGKAVYHSIGDAQTKRLMKRDIETGEETEVHREKSNGTGFFGLSVSPDGSRLAFALNVGENLRAVMTVAAEGGTSRELYRGDFAHPGLRGGAWTKDGRYYLAVAIEASGAQLWAFPVDGGQPRKLDISMQTINSPAVSPDGRRIAFTGTQNKPELWVIRNLLTDTGIRN